MIKLLVLLSVCSLALSLKCYDCTPDDPDDGCLHPEKSNVKQTNCDSDAAKQSPTRKLVGPLLEGGEKTCFTFFFKADEGSALKSGIYRGCSNHLDTSNSSCKLELEPGTQGSITSCTKCAENGCNNEEKNSSPATPTVSLLMLLLMFGLWFCFSLANF